MPESTALALVPEQIDEFLDTVVPAEGEATRTPARVAADAQRALVGGLHTMGYTREEISRVCDISLATVGRVLARLRKDKKLAEGLAETLVRVENEALPLAMESLLAHLAKHDKDMTLETLKGRGVFRNFNHVKNEGAGGEKSKPFTVNIINQPNTAQIAVPADAIKGTPRQLGAPETVIDIET